MLIVTLGDPLSINIECLSKVMKEQHSQLPDLVTLIGHRPSLEFELKRLGSDLLESSSIKLIEVCKEISCSDPTQMSADERGKIAAESLLKVKEFSLDKTAILTAPIDKSLTQKHGFPYPGQTEYFADLAKERGIMVLAGPKLRVGLATNHLAVKDISPSLNQHLIVEKVKLLHRTLLETCDVEKPRIGVTGLNPHCGDNGLFGTEDREIIRPAIDELQSLGVIDVQGPLPADTAFFRCYQGELDGILAMYHDQGLGPLKTVHFYDAVNITGGLPFLRVSPDHGPASNLYGTGQGNQQSFAEALKHCLRYLNGKGTVS